MSQTVYNIGRRESQEKAIQMIERDSNRSHDRELAADAGRPAAVTSVVRALRILASFDASRPLLGVSELARGLGLSKTTIHRLLQTLESEGFVRKMEGSRYALGWKVFELGMTLQVSGEFQDIILSELSRLVERAGETAHLGILDRGQVLYLEKVESSRRLRMPSAVGRRVPAHATALGKALIASLSDDEVRRIVRDRGLARMTSATICDEDDLMCALAEIRERGYSMEREEIEEGLMCIAAAIVDEQGAACAAVSISGPVSRLATRVDEAAAMVRDCSRTLSERLGGSLHWLASLRLQSIPADVEAAGR